jgi:hypothetical protein
MTKLTFTIPGYPYPVVVQGNYSSEDISNIVKGESTSIDTDTSMSFERHYEFLNETNNTFYRNLDRITTASDLYVLKQFEGSESFGEAFMKIGKMALNAIITAIKVIISFLKKFIMNIGAFIRDKIIYKLFGKPKSKQELDDLAAAYDKYCDTPITWTGDSTDDIPSLSDNLKENLRFMKFQGDNFDIINRVSSVTTNAVKSIQTSFKMNKHFFNTDIGILRTYGIIYGDSVEENIYEQQVQKKNKLSPLSFYHERYFMEFVYYIDKITNGNLAELIDEGRDSLNNKIDLNINGKDVAEAIILNCSLNNLQRIKSNKNNINIDKMTIRDVISKDVFLRIAGGNITTLNKLSYEASATIENSNILLESLEEFQKHLEIINNRSNLTANYNPANNYVTPTEIHKWIEFLVSFTTRFMTYRLDMIHIIKRVLNIINKKNNISISSKKDVMINKTILGSVPIYTDEKFENLNYSELVKDAKDIMIKHARNLYYDNKLPICVVPVRDYRNDVAKINGYNGFAISIFSRYRSDFMEIKRLLDSNSNDEKKIVNYCNTLITGTIPIYDKIIGTLIIIDVNSCKYYAKEYLDVFPQCINYYSLIVHETTHAVQNRYNVKTLHDDIVIELTKDTKIDAEILKYIKENPTNDTNNNGMNKNLIRKEMMNQGHLTQYYRLNNNESEAFKEQYYFLISTIDTKYKEYAKDILIKYGKNNYGLGNILKKF